MKSIIERVPLLAGASALLTGAMLVGAAATYAYQHLTSTVVFAGTGDCGVSCDAEDPDDCSGGCPCHDPSALCRQ